MPRPMLAAALVGILVAAARAEAQGPIEVGGGLAFAALENGGDFWGDGVKHVGAEVHATLPLTQRFGLDLSTTVGHRNLRRQQYSPVRIEGGEIRRTEGMYTINVRQRIGRRTPGTSYGFASYGLAGLFSTTSYAPLRETYPNGQVDTYPGSTSSNHLAPGFPVVGGGFQKELSPRLAVRADTIVLFFLYIPVGFRASATAVVPLGQWTTR